jgi:DNA repair exonuclease SbcCD ATPase subunit
MNKQCKECGGLLSEFPVGDCTTPHSLDTNDQGRKGDAPAREWTLECCHNCRSPKQFNGENFTCKTTDCPSAGEHLYSASFRSFVEKSAYLALKGEMESVREGFRQYRVEQSKYCMEQAFKFDTAQARIAELAETPGGKRIYACMNELTAARQEIERLKNLNTQLVVDETEWQETDGQGRLEKANARIDTLEFQLNDKQNSLGNYKEMVQKNLARIKELEVEVRDAQSAESTGNRILAEITDREQKLVAALGALIKDYHSNCGGYLSRSVVESAEGALKAHRGEGV